MHLEILTTGGTIDKLYFDQLSEFQVGDPQIGEVLRQAQVDFTHRITPLLRKDSLDLTDADRAVIRQTIEASPHPRWLVTHGTDTMAVTGRYLQGLAGKTVVLTGAMHPARFRESDAIFNIGFALAALQLLPEGIYLAINGRLWDPAKVRKNRPANRFEEIE